MFQIITKTDSVKTECLIALIYGDPGIGKTSLSFTTNNAVALDFDGGVQRACFRQTTVRVQNWEEVIQFQESKELKALAPKTLIIDTAGGMLDNYIADYVRKADPKNARRGGELALQGYGAMKSVFSQFKNWAKAQRINLVFVAHTTTVDEGDNTKFIPKVTGGAYDIIRQECDLVGYLTSNKNRRTLDFNPTDTHIGKNCAELPVMEIPDYKTDAYPTFLQSIIDTTLEKMNAMSEKQADAVNAVEEFKAAIEGIETAEDLNTFIPILSEQKEKPVMLQVWAALKSRASKIGITYDKDQKVFVPPATIPQGA